MTDEKRTRHPYHMYDAIQGQPDAFVQVAGRNDAEAGRFAARAASCDRIFLVGTGTSSHAALIGEPMRGLDIRKLPEGELLQTRGV